MHQSRLASERASAPGVGHPGDCAPKARPLPGLRRGRDGGRVALGSRSLSARSLARRGAGGGGSVSHGDSRFRCRKGGSAGGGRGEEARLFTRLKRAWGCIPRLPETCLSLPPVEALYRRQRYTERWAGSWGVLLEPQGTKGTHPRNTPKRPSSRPHTHTNTYRLPQTPQSNR